MDRDFIREQRARVLLGHKVVNDETANPGQSAGISSSSQANVGLIRGNNGTVLTHENKELSSHRPIPEEMKSIDSRDHAFKDAKN